MTASLTFRVRLGDLYEMMPRSRSRLSTIFDWAAALFMLSVAWKSYSIDGVNWVACGTLLAAVYLVFWHEFLILTMWPFLGFWKSNVEIAVNDESISSGSNGTMQTIPWSSFQRSGSFQESKKHFSLECGRGAVWIPKRAFATSADVVAFREFVSIRLGEPSSFNGLGKTRREPVPHQAPPE